MTNTALQPHEIRGGQNTGAAENTAEIVLGAMRDAIRSVTHLQVVTIVGEAVADTSMGLDRVSVRLPNETGVLEISPCVLATNIDLAFGDISQSLSPRLLDGASPDVLALHQEMLLRAQSLVENNLRLLGDLAQTLRTPGR